MVKDVDFWFGMGAGVMTGVLVGMMMPGSGKSMKTQVGESIHNLGVAVDHTVDHLTSNLH